MSQISAEVTHLLNQYLTSNSIDKGSIPVSIDVFLSSFKENYQDTPVTKSLLGRILSQKFLKKQIKTQNGYNQCYYVNKIIE